MYRRSLAAALLSLSFSWPAHATLRVLASTTDMQSLTQAVGGPAVKVDSLTLPGQDAEAYETHPADLHRVQDAQLIVRVGLDYDLWLDPLLRLSGRADLQRGGKAYVDASVGITLLEVQASPMTQGGHAHGLGNPHYWLDPLNAEMITANIMLGLARVAPQDTALFERNRTQFLRTLNQRMSVWMRATKDLSNQPVLVFHNSWPYFARRFRLHVVDTIETKPGVPASPAHLAALSTAIRRDKIAAIIKTPVEDARVPRFLASRGTDVQVLDLAPSVGALPGTQDYLALFDYNIALLSRLQANHAGAAPSKLASP